MFHLSGAGRFKGVYSGMVLNLVADTMVTLPPHFAELFVGPAELATAAVGWARPAEKFRAITHAEPYEP